MHAGGFSLKEEMMNEQQRFFICRGGRGLTADVEADALGVEAGLLGFAQERQGLIERCAEFRVEVDERLAVVDLHAHEHIGAGRRGREFWYLAFIVEREALDAEAGGRREAARIVHRIGVDHARAVDAGIMEHLHLAGRGDVEVRAERGEALECTRMRIGLDGIVDAGARQVPAQERVVFRDFVDGQHEEWRRLSLG